MPEARENACPQILGRRTSSAFGPAFFFSLSALTAQREPDETVEEPRPTFSSHPAPSVESDAGATRSGRPRAPA